MGISDGQPIDAANSNPAWIDANADDVTTGILGLSNVAPASGAFITNIQRVANRLLTATGVDETSADGTTYGAPPSTIDDGDNHETALTKLADKFNSSAAGHKHDGTAGQGAVIDVRNLSDAPKRASLFQAVDLSSVSGTSTDVSAQFSGKSPSTSPLVNGVVVNFPENKVLIRQASGLDEDDRFVDSNGDVIFGRLTEAAGVWTLSFFVMQSAVEVAHSFSSNDIRWYYQEIFDLLAGLAPVYSEFANIPSDNVTADIISATETQEGKVRRATNVETTTAVVQSQDTRLPIQGENDALVGTNGTPATGNPYVTDSDPRNTNQRDALSIQTKDVISPLAPTDGQVLAFNTANNQYESVTPAPAGASASNEAGLLENLGVDFSVSGGALTIAMKQADGSTDPAAAPNAVRIGYNDPTEANGGFNIRSNTAAEPLVISFGSTLGMTSGKREYIYVYGVDNGSKSVFGASLTLFDEGKIEATTAEGGAGAADNAAVLYTTAVQSDRPIRLLFRIRITLTTAGDWDAVPSVVAGNFSRKYTLGSTQIFTSSGTWTRPNGVTAIRVRVWGAGGGGGGAVGNLSAAAGAGGGGGGGYSESFITFGLGATEAITIGAAGSGGAAGNNPGTAGGNSSFASLVIANGGSLGGGSNSQTSDIRGGGGGSGGTIGTGNIVALGGDPGGTGVVFGTGGFSISGEGGGRGGGRNVQGNSGGLAGVGQGAGGSGGNTENNATDRAGGPGTIGLIVVEEYY